MRISREFPGEIGDPNGGDAPRHVAHVETIANGLTGQFTVTGKITPPWTGPASVRVGDNERVVYNATFDTFGGFTLQADGRLGDGDEVIVGFDKFWVQVIVAEP